MLLLKFCQRVLALFAATLHAFFKVGFGFRHISGANFPIAVNRAEKIANFNTTLVIGFLGVFPEAVQVDLAAITVQQAFRHFIWSVDLVSV